MVTAIKDRTQLEAIDRIPRSRYCLTCGGYLFIEDGLHCVEAKCLNCGRVAAAFYSGGGGILLPSLSSW